MEGIFLPLIEEGVTIESDVHIITSMNRIINNENNFYPARESGIPAICSACQKIGLPKWNNHFGRPILFPG